MEQEKVVYTKKSGQTQKQNDSKLKTDLAIVATQTQSSKSAGEARGKGEEGSLAAVEKKLEELIAAVRAGGDVYMDSNKVGKAQVLGTYKSK